MPSTTNQDKLTLPSSRRLTLNLSVPSDVIVDFREKLQDIACQLGFRHGFRKESVSALLSGTVTGEVLVVPAKGNSAREAYLNESSTDDLEQGE